MPTSIAWVGDDGSVSVESDHDAGAQSGSVKRRLRLLDLSFEKVFAIRAEPVAIWDALWRDLGKGDGGRFSIEQSNWPHGFTIRLDLARLPVLLSYRIERKDGHCEVSAILEPLGFRYMLYQVLSFGHMRRNYEILLVEGLSNLKRALEGQEG